MLKFIENPLYREANNISSALAASRFLSNAYVLESDLLLSNPKIISAYHYASDFLAIRKKYTEDWCFEEKNGIIQSQRKKIQDQDILIQSQKAEMIAQKGLIDHQETYIKTQEYILSDKEKMFSLQEALIEDQKKRLKKLEEQLENQ